jgi:hypothetical protein
LKLKISTASKNVLDFSRVPTFSEDTYSIP